MKFFPLLLVVITVHLGIAALLLLQPGCQNTPEPAPDPEMTAPGMGAADNSPGFVADVPPEFNAPEVAGPQPLAPPRRPAGAAEPVGSASLPGGPAAGQLLNEDAFNADFSDTGVLQPVGAALQPAADSAAAAALQGGRTYTVERGDTLTGIARDQGVSLDALLAANGLTRASTLYPGDTLQVPSAGTGASSAPASANNTYLVQRGDTLSAIAVRFDVSLRDLRALNNLESDLIRVGQTLRLPAAARTPARSDAAVTRRSAPATQQARAGSAATYTVQPGDNLTLIAERFGTRVSVLMELNAITDPRRLRSGDVLLLPTTSAAASGTAVIERGTTPPPRTRSAEPVTLRPQVGQPSILRQPLPGDFAALEDDDLPVQDVEEVDDERSADNQD